MFNYTKLREFGYEPILNHDSKSFKRLEEEVSKITKGIVKLDVDFKVILSNIENAFAVTNDKKYFIGITDTLLQEISLIIIDLLNDKTLSSCIDELCDFKYSVGSNYVTKSEMISNNITTNNLDPNNIFLSQEIFYSTAIFIILHEAGHIFHNHFELKNQNTFCMEFDDKQSYNEPNHFYEYEADAEASCWFTQRLTSFIKKNTKLKKDEIILFLIIDIISIMLLFQYLESSETVKSTGNSTHPKNSDRINNALFWILNVLEGEKFDLGAEETINIITKVNYTLYKISDNLGWSKDIFKNLNPQNNCK